MLVVIDSTEVYEDWNLKRLRTQRVPVLQKSGHRLGLPMVVFDEHWGQLTRALAEWWTSPASKILPVVGIDFPRLESGMLQQKVDAAKLLCLQLLRDADVEVFAYPTVPHAE